MFQYHWQHPVVEKGLGKSLHPGETVFDNNTQQRPSEDFSEKFDAGARQSKFLRPDERRDEFADSPQNGELYGGGKQRIARHPVGIGVHFWLVAGSWWLVALTLSCLL